MKVIFKSDPSIKQTTYWLDRIDTIYEFTLADIDKCRETAEQFCNDDPSHSLDVIKDEPTDKLFYAYHWNDKNYNKK